MTRRFFINVHCLIKVKFHLHHSHVTGKIKGYAHDFCNTMVIEKTSPLFGFDLHYFIKVYIASAWCSKSLDIAGNNLTQINFSNTTGEIKLVVKDLTEKFLSQHSYFSSVWTYFSSKKKKKY